MTNESESTWSQLWEWATRELGNPTEARFVIEHVSGIPRREFGRHAGKPVPDDKAAQVRGVVERRKEGEPLQYALGSWPFVDIELKVDRRALIPRPETEEMAQFAKRMVADVGERDLRVLDMGTGTGAIALHLAHSIPTARVTATDKSSDALDLARENARRLQLEGRVDFRQGSWFAALPEDSKNSFDLIVSNPPYVSTGDADSLDKSVVEWGPHSALFAGEDGLDDIRAIIAEARQWLKSGACLLIELDPSQSDEAIALALAAGFPSARCERDMTNRPRWLVART